MSCYCKSWYTVNAEVYTGSIANKVSTVNYSDLPLSEQYLLRLTEPVHDFQRTIVCDNWFTSIPAALKHVEKKLTLVGTIRKNKREIPPLFLETKTRQKQTSMYAHTNELTLLSWCHDKKQKKIVLMLSSLHNAPDVDRRNRIPEIMNFCNQNKSGVDVFDRLSKNFSASRAKRRWTFTMLFGLLNIGGINSYISWKNNPSQETSRKRSRSASLSGSTDLRKYATCGQNSTAVLGKTNSIQGNNALIEGHNTACY